jgi:hypothetical protein
MNMVIERMEMIDTTDEDNGGTMMHTTDGWSIQPMKIRDITDECALG